MAHVQVTCQAFIGSLFLYQENHPSNHFIFKHRGVTGQSLSHSGLGRFFHPRKVFSCQRIGLLYLEPRTQTSCFLHSHPLQGFERQRQKHLPLRVQQDPRTVLPTHPRRTCLPSHVAKIIGQEVVSKVQDECKNRHRVQGRSRGKRLAANTKHFFSQSRNIGLSQIRCTQNSISQRFLITQLWISQRRYTSSLSRDRMSRFLEMVSNLVSFCMIIDFREMWWGSTLDGEPQSEKN